MAGRALCVLYAALLLACLAAASHSNTFFVIGDWGSAGVPIYAPTQKVRPHGSASLLHHMSPTTDCSFSRSPRQSVANAMGKVGSSLKPNFILSTGDNFYDSGVASTKDPLWKDAWSACPFAYG